jgi:hypothetical protein
MFYFKYAIFAGYLACVSALIYAMAVSFVTMLAAGVIGITFSYCVGKVLGLLHVVLKDTNAPDLVKQLI